MNTSMTGKVWLVGGGPGDPGLLTVRGAEALAEADAIVYDRLVNPALLDRARAGSERIYAGKAPRRAALSQDEINQTLVRLAQEGKRVVRLKGGDPFVFGRGGEECEALRAVGIPCEVVPGVSSAIAAPAYAGIPVSHRGVAASFAVVTGHEDPEKGETRIDWRALAAGVDTIICLMGVEGLEAIAERLQQGGRSPQTPAALIRWGTLPRQQTVTAPLAEIAARAQAAGFGPPAVLVVGEVVRLREALQWFETRPLFGKRVLITRTRQQASELRTRLEGEGAEVVELPTLEIVDGASPQLIGRVIDALADGEYSWVIFTSANGVRRFFAYVEEAGRDARAFHAKVAVVGPGTAAALASYGIRADAMPQESIGEAIAGAIPARELARRRVLAPRAEGARPELIAALRAQGAEVEEIPLYSSEVPRNPDPAIVTQIREGTIDVVTFASSSSVRNLVKMLDNDISGLAQATVACIGPITAQSARRCGLEPAIVARDHSVPGLLAALRQHFAEPSSGPLAAARSAAESKGAHS